MASPTQTDRLMKFTSPLGQDTLLIESLQGNERISQLFDFHADLLAVAGTVIAPASIVGKKVTIDITLLDVQGSRYVNGLVASFEQLGGDKDFDVYRVHIVPSLWQLKLSMNCRVFQGKTVVDIIKEVIKAYGVTVSDQTAGPFQVLDYCTQYDETDFDFISRLAEQHGIFYWFEHTDSDNIVNFSDVRTAYADCPLVSTVKYAPNSDSGEDRYMSAIGNFSTIAIMVTGKHTTWDYDYRTYQVNKVDPRATASAFANNTFERYTYPGGEEGYVKEMTKNLSTPQHAKGFNEAQAVASDVGAEVMYGASSARSFTCGYTFTMTDHPRDAWNRKYVLVKLDHKVDQVPPYRSHGSGASRGDYQNSFSAISSDSVYKSRAVTPRPRIYGPQTAIVVAPSGEQMQVDKLGRVCVQFFWDRTRPADTVDNTWVRVAQTWAGNGWGTFFWPRAKDEVIVQFLNGDPDNPIIVGSVYNGVNVPKYALPDMSTRSGVVTRSENSKSGENANELRFEDKAGEEQIFLNAERDMDHRTENDHRRYVGGQDSLIVKGVQYDEITGDRHSNMKANRVEKIAQKADLDIGADLSQKVGQNFSLSVGGALAEKVTMGYTMDAMTVYLKGSETVVIESGMNLCLKAAGGFITIGPAGIAISGPMVMINSGGAAVPGAPGQLTDPGPPTAPDEADDGSKGGKM